MEPKRVRTEQPRELRKPLQALYKRQPESATAQWGVKDKETIEWACAEKRREAGESSRISGPLWTEI
jgi:hypothetical protein